LFTVFAKDTINYPIKGHDLLNSKIKLVFGESLPDCTAGRKKTKFPDNDDGKKEKNHLSDYGCSFLIICFIGSLPIAAATAASIG
jgi:hypothetical protein